jgi:hypothetical protein
MSATYQLEFEIDDDGDETWRVRREDGPEMELLLSTSEPHEAAELFKAHLTLARVLAASPTALPYAAPVRTVPLSATHAAIVTTGRCHLTKGA